MPLEKDMTKKIMIIGGGAAGLMAAIQAARCGASVTILEKNESPGKKILVTGNGRCNLTNLGLDPNAYHGEDPSFAKKAAAVSAERSRFSACLTACLTLIRVE